MSKKSPRFIFRFWPAPLPIVFVVLVLCLLVWLLCLDAVREGREMVIDAVGLFDLCDTTLASRAGPRASERLSPERFMSVS